MGGLHGSRGLACILGGPQSPASPRHLKQSSRKVCRALPGTAVTRALGWSQHSISFDFSVHPRSTRAVGALPLICTPIISGVAIPRTLIEDGTGPTVTIGAGLSPEMERMLVAFLRENRDMFAWSMADMTGVHREVIEHHLPVCPNMKHVKQKARHQAPEKQGFIVQEVKKMEKAWIIREVIHPKWIANPVVVPKHTDDQRLCIGYTDLNKVCPKEHFPLP